MDTIGPISRSVEDAAITLGAIAGHDPKDPYTWNTPVPDYRLALDGDVRGLRIGVVTELMDGEQVQSELNIVGNGTEALAFLRRQGQYREAPRPDLVLLDLNLPGKDGREVLAEVKADPALSRIPIVVMTSSRAHEDLLESQKLRVDGYVPKPFVFAQLQTLAKHLKLLQ